MKLLRPGLVLVLIFILIIAAFVWWNWPRRVDMAQYAPADSLVYLECNDLPAVAQALLATDAWKENVPRLGIKAVQPISHWWLVAGSFGLGSAESVILSRAQLAVVLLSLDASEENSTLSIKPQGALIIETHTSNWRLRPAVERTLQKFAEKTYGQVSLKRYSEEADYYEWSPASGNRKIVAAIDDTVVIVGNNKRSVQACLEARHGQRPTLRNDTTLRQMRAKVGARQGLSFGYVSPGNATKLLSWGAPILVGRGPGDSSLAQIIAKSAAKVLGAVAWSARPSNGGIEDRFFVALEPAIVSRLQPAFTVGPGSDSFWTVIPSEVESITVYRAASPAHAWDALRAVSSQFDALSAVVFGSVLKAALIPYGIEDPDKFLNAVSPEVATIKLRQGTGGTVLMGRVMDRAALEQMFRLRAAAGTRLDGSAVYSTNVADKNFAAAFVRDYFVIGAPEDVRILTEADKSNRTMQDEKVLSSLNRFSPEPSSSIVTYANDTDRARSFLSTVLAIESGSANSNTSFNGQISVPFSSTETNLSDEGLERRTRSAFGQFSTLIALLKQQ